MINAIKAVYLFLALAVGLVAATVGTIWGLYELHAALDTFFTSRFGPPSDEAVRPANVAIAFACGALFLAFATTANIVPTWTTEEEDERVRREWREMYEANRRMPQ